MYLSALRRRRLRRVGIRADAALIGLLLSWFGASAGAQVLRAPPQVRVEGALEISAEHIRYEAEQQLYVARGSVRIEQSGRRLEADRVRLSLASRRGVASGSVRFREGDQTVRAEFMTFDIDTLDGTLSQADIDSGARGFRIRAREIVKRGDRHYGVRDGRFTACRCSSESDRLPWQIESDRTQIELGGYGEARNSTFDVLGVPVLWIPWMLYPVKSDRETGLLFPEIAFGGLNGVQLGLPFFWAALPQLNVVATPRYLQERGFQPNLEFEYVLGRRSGGSLRGSFVRDRSFQGADRPPYVPNRWAAQWQHDQYLPAGWRARVDLDLVSDNLYLNDFDEFGGRRHDFFLRSSAFAFRHFGRQGRVGVFGALRYADDVRSGLPEDRDGVLLQRWPEFSLARLPGRDRRFAPLGITTAVEAEYSYFTTRESVTGRAAAAPAAAAFFRDTGLDARPLAAEQSERDGVYQEGEPLLARGHRLLLRARVARPLSLARGVDLLPSFGYGESLYDTGSDGFAERGVFSAGADLRARLSGELAPFGAGRVRHRLEPFAHWLWLRPRAQAGTPIFVPPSQTPQTRLRQLSLDNFVLDPSDRMERHQLVVVGVDNHFAAIAPRRAAGRRARSGSMRAEFSLSFAHDFETGSVGRLVLDGRMTPRGGIDARVDAAWNAESRVLDEALVETSVGLPAEGPFDRNRLQLRYRYLRQLPLLVENGAQRVSQFDLRLDARAFGRLDLGYGVTYSVETHSPIRHGGRLLYASGCHCWSAGIEIGDDRTRGVYYRVLVSLLGLGDSVRFGTDRGLVSRRRH